MGTMSRGEIVKFWLSGLIMTLIVVLIIGLVTVALFT